MFHKPYDDAARAGLPFKDYKAWLDRRLTEACKMDGVSSIDEVRRQYGRIDSLLRRGEEAKPGIRGLIAERIHGDAFTAAFNNVQTLTRMVRRINYPHIIDHAESDILFMVSFLTLYEGLYVNIVDVLYEAVEALDSGSRRRRHVPDTLVKIYRAAKARCSGTQRRKGTAAKANRLAGEGIDIRRVMRTDIRNAAAHMGFTAIGGLIEVKMSNILIDTTATREHVAHKDLHKHPERVTHINDVLLDAERSIVSLHHALLHWYEVHEGPWSRFSDEFFTTDAGFRIAYDAVGRMGDAPEKEWCVIVREAQAELAASGDR